MGQGKDIDILTANGGQHATRKLARSRKSVIETSAKAANAAKKSLPQLKHGHR